MLTQKIIASSYRKLRFIGSDVDISSRTNSTMGGDDGCTIDEQSGRTPDGDNARITDNITITHPVYIDQQ